MTRAETDLESTWRADTDQMKDPVWRLLSRFCPSAGQSTGVVRWGAGRLSPEAEARFVQGATYCGNFFMGQAEAQLALYRLTAILEAEDLPYAIIGAFALNEYGHRRVTMDVDLVMRDEHRQEFKRRHLGKGYIELKLASGMAAPHRGKDLVDVQELIRIAGLAQNLADELHPWVRGKFLELWQLAQTPDPF